MFKSPEFVIFKISFDFFYISCILFRVRRGQREIYGINSPLLPWEVMDHTKLRFLGMVANLFPLTQLIGLNFKFL